MSDSTGENQLSLMNREMREQISILEETLFEKGKDAEMLRDSEKRYRRLFESAQDGILILDAQSGKVVDVNPFLLRLLGYSYSALYVRIPRERDHRFQRNVITDSTPT